MPFGWGIFYFTEMNVTKSIAQRLVEIRDECNKIAGKGVEFSEDDGKKFETLMGEATTLEAQAERERKFGELKSRLDTTPGNTVPGLAGSTEAGETVIETMPGKDGAIKAKLVDQYGEGILSNKTMMATTTSEYKSAFRDYLKYGERGLSSSAIKTLQEGIDTEGGFTVPVDMLDMVISKDPTPTNVSGLVTQLQTGRDTMVIPRVNYTNDDLFTTGIQVNWTGEAGVPGNATDPIFGQTRIPVYTAMFQIPVTNDMIEDSNFDVLSWLSGKFGETVTLTKDKMILTGNGRGQPTGILNAPGADSYQPAVVNMGNPITPDNVLKLAFSLAPQYDNAARYVFNKRSLGLTVAQMKDTAGRYLWGNGLQDSGLSPNIHNRVLAGYPAVWSEFMPSVGANNFVMLFGDFSGYFMVNRIGLSVRVLNEVAAQSNQVIVLGRVRFGGVIAESWKLFAGKQA